jgi:hypothetical protein
MAYEGEESKHCARIEAAQKAVAQAMSEYSRGRGNLSAVNKANAELADAHCRWREWSGGRVPDDR